MLASAVSSRRPSDFHPSSIIGQTDCRPVKNRQAPVGLPNGCPKPAVGMHRAVHSEMGLPRIEQCVVNAGVPDAARSEQFHRVYLSVSLQDRGRAPRADWHVVSHDGVSISDCSPHRLAGAARATPTDGGSGTLGCAGPL